MIDIKKLSAGQLVWDIKKNYNTWEGTIEYSHWPVNIIEVNLEEGFVIASWNNNKPEKIRANKNKFPWFKEEKND